MIEEFGLNNWKQISIEFYQKSAIMRSPKQCRDRWISVLKTKGNFKVSRNQLNKVFCMFEIYGSRWSQISKFFPNFSENRIKNLINSTVRRNIRRFNKNRNQDQKLIINTIELLNIEELKPLLTSDKSRDQAWFDSLILSKEVLITANAIKSRKGMSIDKELSLNPISDSFSIEFPILYEIEKTDLPCEDLFN